MNRSLDSLTQYRKCRDNIQPGDLVDVYVNSRGMPVIYRTAQTKQFRAFQHTYSCYGSRMALREDPPLYPLSPEEYWVGSLHLKIARITKVGYQS